MIPQVVDAVGVPVIAAGGITDGRGISAALALGASAAPLGTAFLATHESNASEAHKSVLTSPAARTTSLPRVFSGRLARGVRNALMTELEAWHLHDCHLLSDIPPGECSGRFVT